MQRSAKLDNHLCNCCIHAKDQNLSQARLSTWLKTSARLDTYSSLLECTAESIGGALAWSHNNERDQTFCQM